MHAFVEAFKSLNRNISCLRNCKTKPFITTYVAMNYKHCTYMHAWLPFNNLSSTLVRIEHTHKQTRSQKCPGDISSSASDKRTRTKNTPQKRMHNLITPALYARHLSIGDYKHLLRSISALCRNWPHETRSPHL